MKMPVNNCSSPYAPLINEHDDARKFILRIREKGKKESLDQLEKYFCWFWQNHIRPHFLLEEKIMSRFFPMKDNLRHRIEDDHADIRDLVLSLGKEFEIYSLFRLCTIIEMHIEFEEQVFFPAIEKNLEESDKLVIEQMIREAKKEIPGWPESFWN